VTVVKTKMRDWWRKVEEDYREKRRQEDEQWERERRERVRRKTVWELQEEAKGLPEPPLEELFGYMEREWGVTVPWDEYGMTRPKPPGVVEVEIGGARQKAGRAQKAEGGLAEKALMLVLTGKFR